MQNKKTVTKHSQPKKTIDLSIEELQNLIQKYNLVVSKDSPLYHLLDNKSKNDSTVPISNEYLKNESDWKPILSTLCIPNFKVTIALVFPDRVASKNYYSNRDNSDTIIGYWEINERIHISFPWEPSEILAEGFVALDINNTPYPEKTKMQLTFDGLISFAAAVDSIRTIMLGSIISRKFLSDFKLPIDHLELMLRLSIEDKGSDARWLMTLVRMFTPDKFALSNIKLTKKGFGELIDLGLVVAKENNQWAPTSKLLDLTSHWIVPLPVVYHESTVIGLEKQQNTISSFVLRGSGPLSLFDFKKDDDNRLNISFQTIDSSAYWLLMMGRIIPSKNRMKITKEIQVNKCPSCDSLIHQNDRFCKNCGYKLPENQKAIEEAPKVKTCTSCGSILKPGTKFCMQCGIKVLTD